jgi:crotonobetainyl-CoA:carnitine CoA-transferase CaiB-like acyl-CoA transferase
MNTPIIPNTGPLKGLRVLDLTRILAGPVCTQLFGDLGADVIKIERSGAGDDTRKWGPPYVRDENGENTAESAYYLTVNRNKRSVAVDVAKPEGAALVRELLKHCDVLVENFKVGGLEKYGLSYDDLKQEFPDLVYCSITGFGQTGPYAAQAGYDYLAQGMGGVMSITGEPDGQPMKVGVAIADIMCGMYASTAVLAAIHHRDATGQGQHIDLALLDTQVSWLANVAMNYLASGVESPRLGNQHPNIVPYQVFSASDGYFILAVGNDGQFRKFCDFAGLESLPDDPKFITNDKRVHNRDELVPMIEAVTQEKSKSHWLDGLSGLGVPAGPVNTVSEAFADPQVQHREMRITMPHAHSGSGTVDLIGNPVKMSETPVSYRIAPPVLGEHTDQVLEELLEMNEQVRSELRDQGIIG